MIANDAAGEGVNLQRGAHLMVNYDLPWNPNRLEQRFGRIHRIGQTEDCHVWNLCAVNTREGEVYQRLLEKLEEARKALGDKVYDVLGELFEGQSLRDLLIGAPVFWVGRPAYVLASIAPALAIWLFGFGRTRETALLWLDALGMAAYAVVGAAKAEAHGAPPVSAVVMGILTATFGGVVREVLAGEPSVLLRREVYVTAALLGAGAYVALNAIGVEQRLASLIGFAAALGLRSAAITWHWSLPGFRGRSPKDGD